LQELLGAGEDGVGATPYVTDRGGYRDRRRDADSFEDATVRVGIVLGADAGGASAGQREQERLTGAPAGSFSDQGAAVHRVEGDDKVFGS
jgi:hypothetical protein